MLRGLCGAMLSSILPNASTILCKVAGVGCLDLFGTELVSSQRLATLLFTSLRDSGISECRDPEEGNRKLGVK